MGIVQKERRIEYEKARDKSISGPADGRYAAAGAGAGVGFAFIPTPAKIGTGLAIGIPIGCGVGLALGLITPGCHYKAKKGETVYAVMIDEFSICN